ncbi:MAG: methionine--tRNA ligase subunit beta [Candidatus Omnitrophica bacterium]|nr:methionine--tRNA ligase subunit beta [Candidatus Omnitrophota bacterium]
MATIDQFKQLEFKVARIAEAKLHPNADRLLVLTVDTGTEKKEVVAGIAQHYKPEELPGKLVVLVNNLEPAVIRGVASSGMVLAASDGQTLTLVSPEKAIPPGAQVR